MITSRDPRVTWPGWRIGWAALSALHPPPPYQSSVDEGTKTYNWR